MNKVSYILKAFILLAMTACSTSPASVPAGERYAKDRLVFVSRSTGNDEIYAINLDGSGLVNLSNNPANDGFPIWSPDGLSIGFQSDRSGKNAIYIMRADGTQVREVAGTGPLDYLSGWSPDGRYLLITSTRDVNGEIYIITIDSGEAINLTRNPAADEAPAWSPDGKRILFTSDREAPRGRRILQIYVQDLESGTIARLTDFEQGAVDPLWSPDGKQIAFGVVQSNNVSVDTFVMQADGSNPRPLTKYYGGWAVPQTWSPDGRSVVINYFTGVHGEQCATQIKSPLGLTDTFSLPEAAIAGAYRQRWWTPQTAAISPIVLPQAPAPAALETPTTLVLVNGTLIDGTGAGPRHDAAIVIRDGKIVAAGNRADVKIPDTARVIDVHGAAILPGFFNTHVHDAYDAHNLAAWVQAGVTTVCDLNNGTPAYDRLFAFRDAVLAHPRYTRLVAAGPMVTVPGGYPIAYWNAGGLTVTSPSDAREKVMHLLDAGADIIKIPLESGSIFGQVMPMLSKEEASAIVSVAHERGTTVLAHVSIVKDLETAINAKVDAIAHMVIDKLPDELIARMVADDIYWIPTLELWHKTHLGYAFVEDNLRRFVAAGGKVALGTDYDGAPNVKFDLGMPTDEIKYMSEAGMNPLQIIVAATRNAAHVSAQEKELGTLETGKTADVLVVDGDPLQDMSALTRVKMVIHGGVIVRE